METISPSSSMTAKMKGSNFDELSMQQNLLFSDSLKDLKNLRSQLYSAAEYFELSYTNDDQKRLVINTLKDYTIKALVNTVHHLGSVSFKVNGLLDQKVDETPDMREYIDGGGASQQSLVITAPKYHKRYMVPGSSTPESGKHAVAKYEELNPSMEEMNSQQFQSAIRSPVRDTPPSFRKGRSQSPSPRARSSLPLKLRSLSLSPRQGKYITTDKRAGSPLRTSNPLARSRSLSSRSTLLNSSTMRRYPTEPQISSSMRLHAERIDHKDSEQNLSKSKSFLKSLLTRRLSKKDETLYSYLDEY